MSRKSAGVAAQSFALLRSRFSCVGALFANLCRSFSQWTRTQRIRTAAAIPVIALIVDAGSTPVFLEIGDKAAHLRELGMSDRAIAAALGVSDKTVAKSLRHNPSGEAPAGADRSA
jgi:hypothetical protein